MTQNFLKMHGLGNDFVIFDHREGAFAFLPDAVRQISDRKQGVGCDQLIVLEASDKADFYMRIYNADGSQSEACGNATRCVAYNYMKQQEKLSCMVETLAGLLHCRLVEGDMVEVDMGAPKLDWHDIPLSKSCDTLNLEIGQGEVNNPVAVNVGNPHCVFFVDNAETEPVEELGPVFEHHDLFPNRTNVEFAQILAPDKIRLRVWERGVGITQACGSATCATIVAASLRGLSERKAEIVLDGGSLFLEWRESDDHILMTGPVAYVFEGNLTQF